MGAGERPAGSVNTAYARDARPDSGARHRYGWDPVIDALLDRGMHFLDCGFGPGVLFRGLPGGEQPGADGFTPLIGAGGVAAQESALGVVLVSQVLGDALAVARPWEDTQACVWVLDADSFDAALRERRAAVLAFAEAGMVFRYPFFVPPVSAAAVRCVLIAAGATPPTVDVPVHEVEAVDRVGFETGALAALANAGLAPARPRAAGLLPRKRR